MGGFFAENENVLNSTVQSHAGDLRHKDSDIYSISSIQGKLKDSSSLNLPSDVWPLKLLLIWNKGFSTLNNLNGIFSQQKPTGTINEETTTPTDPNVMIPTKTYINT